MINVGDKVEIKRTRRVFINGKETNRVGEVWLPATVIILYESNFVVQIMNGARMTVKKGDNSNWRKA